MQYYAYENWQADGHKVKVHRESCPHCNGGRGQKGGTNPKYGRWRMLGEHEEPNGALVAARRAIRIENVTFCGSCIR